MENEHILDEPQQRRKIFKDKSIFISTFFGGPLVATYIIANNFKVFGEIAKAKRAWTIGILSTIVIFALVMSIPENVKIPSQLIPFIYTGIAQYLMKRYQEKNIESHLANGGEVYGWGRVTIATLLGLGLTLGLLFTYVYISGE